MKHDHCGGITVLFFDVHLDAGRLRTLSKLGQIFQSLACARRKSHVRRGRVQQEQPGVADHGEPERTIERRFARLLEIDCAENARQIPHVITSR